MSQRTSQPSGAPQQPSQRPLGGDSMEIDPPEQPGPSVDPPQSLSGAAAMTAALTDIENEAASTRTIRNTRRPVGGPNSADILRQRIQARAATEASGPTNRIRTSSAGSPTEPAKRAKTGPPHHVIDFPFAKPATNRPTTFDHLSKPQKLSCAVMIDGDQEAIMGDPFRLVPGCHIKFDIEPGRYGQPSIGLEFRISKQGTDVTSKFAYNSFTLGWEPGVKVGGQWMLQNVQFYEATKQANEDLAAFCYPDAIRKLCKKQSEAERLFCMTFKSNAHKTSPMDMEWAANWPAAHQNLDRMYNGTEPGYRVTVWFCIPTTNTDRAWNEYLQPFADAAKDHTPPFHQYLDEDDHPFINEDLPSVAEIGNGMYKRYPKANPSGKISNRSGTVSYHTMPKVVTWNSIKSFHVMHGVPIVRDMQYNIGLHIGLETDWHRIFLQRMPAMKTGGEILQPSLKMKTTCLAGIRLTRDANGVKEAIPEPGSTIIVDFSNADSRNGKTHVTNKNDLCFGRVDTFGGNYFLQRTKTDFCALLTIPRRVFTPGEQLALAKIAVKANLLPSKRDVKALGKFCDEQYASELLDPIRLAFWSNPSNAPTKVVDLTEGPAHNRSKENSARYAQILRDMKAKRKSNKDQDAVLMAASSMQGKLAVVQGPPGAGKTRILRDKIIALTKVGHKVLCVASSNVAVDTNAQDVWAGLTPEDRKVIKCLRLETDGAEKAQRLTKLSYADYTGEEGAANDISEYAGPEQASDNPAIRNALDTLCMDWLTHQDSAAKAFQDFEDVEKAQQAIQVYDCMKRSNVPNGMTLDYRVWELTIEDKNQAEIDYQEARNKLSSEEYDRQYQVGKIDVTNFDKSFKYRDCMNKYICKRDKVDRKVRQQLEDESNSILERVLAATHILFTKASNCGGALLEDIRAFEPTIIVCDDAGQISVPSLCVPLTTFDKWEGLFLFGDIQQLEPTVLSGNSNEFIANGKLSPLALLDIKGFPSMLLDEQYRMGPACSRFPRTQFYDGKGLKDSDTVKQDNAVRKAIRKFTKGISIEGDTHDGSEYVVTDVVNGYSRVELNGTSLVNYANAEVIKRMVQRLLGLEGGLIKPKMIQILTYYQGQRRLLRAKLNEIDQPQAIEDIEISIVDSFHGKQARIIIVDMVAAKGNLGEKKEADDEDDEDPGTEDYIKRGTVTGHVRSPKRLNLALTRGEDSTLVVCQAGLLARTMKENRGKQYNAVANMISDAQERNCLLTDYTEDSHPDSVKRRAQLEIATLEKNANVRRVESRKFMERGRAQWQNLKHLSAVHMPEPFSDYRIRGGHTTRPIGNPKVTATADAHDEQLELARAAFVATTEAQAEDQRAFDLALQASRGKFPPLPT